MKRIIIFTALFLWACDDHPTFSKPQVMTCEVQTVSQGSLISCPDGTSSLVTNGIDAQQITIVQFCQGTTTYPTNFDEVGLCINNKIYAVYSANGGFMVEVVPGVYSSNGINSSCTFTVAPNCVIINH